MTRDERIALAKEAGLSPFEQAAAELRAEVERLRAALEAAEYALRSKGYRKSCEISACNCGDQWSHGGNAEARLRELSSELHGSPVDMNGKTLLAGLTELIERAEKAEAEVERLREALEKLARLGNGPHYGNSEGNMIARNALKEPK